MTMLVAEPIDRICDDLVSRVAATLIGKPVDRGPLPLDLVGPENL